MPVLLVTADLAATSKVAGAAAQSGVSLVSRADAANSTRLQESDPYELAIIDLGVPGLRIADAVAQLKTLPQPPRRIIAFGPHVHEQLLQAARDAGCDSVMSRGQFFSQIDAILLETAGND